MISPKLLSFCNGRKAKKDAGVYVVLAVVVCVLIAGIAFVARLFVNQRRFSKFVSNLSNSTTYVQYTDTQGKVYSYISDKITLEKVAARYLTYGNIEMP